MKYALRLLTFGVAVLSMSSCQLYKKYEMPVVESQYMADYNSALNSEKDSSSLCYLGWDKVFKDPLLRKYIQTAIDNNKNLDNTRLNIEVAAAQLKGAKLSYFPSLSFNPNGGTASYGGSHLNWSYTLPLAANWEIDAFGKILNRKRGAKVNVEQMEAYYQAVQSQIVCGIANAYYSIVLLNQQLDLSRRTSEIWKDQVTSMELMKEAAYVNEAAVVQTRANYYSIMSTIPDLENAIHKAQNSLSILMGVAPSQWEVTNNLDFDLPDELVEGVPVYYLAARPDIAALERAVAGAYYATNSARAAFYPSLSISAQGGFTNLLGSIVSNPGEWFIQLAGSLAAPLFSRGVNIANLEVAKAQQKQAMNNFEAGILSAGADVSDALVAYRKNHEKREFILKQIIELEKSVEYTQELLMLDKSATYLEVLTAQTSLLSAQLNSLTCWHEKVNALISLYQAVGGGR